MNNIDVYHHAPPYPDQCCMRGRRFLGGNLHIRQRNIGLNPAVHVMKTMF